MGKTSVLISELRLKNMYINGKFDIQSVVQLLDKLKCQQICNKHVEHVHQHLVNSLLVKGD